MNENQFPEFDQRSSWELDEHASYLCPAVRDYATSHDIARLIDHRPDGFHGYAYRTSGTPDDGGYYVRLHTNDITAAADHVWAIHQHQPNTPHQPPPIGPGPDRW